MQWEGGGGSCALPPTAAHTPPAFPSVLQSGDHGPINSCEELDAPRAALCTLSPHPHAPLLAGDRMPFLTAIRSLGGLATYAARDTETTHSMIIANYGASQGYDGDDGSSWYDIHDNFFYDAAGFKVRSRPLRRVPVTLLNPLAPPLCCRWTMAGTIHRFTPTSLLPFMAKTALAQPHS